MAEKAAIRGIDNKKLILKTTRKLLLKKGVAKTSLSDIAKAANISKGTLYYYYSTKRELIYDIASEHMENITDTLLKWLEGIHDRIAPEEILKHVYETIVMAEPRSKLHIYLLQEAISGHSELLGRFRTSYAQWNGMLSAALEIILPEKRKPEIPVLSTIILTSLTGSIVQHLIGNKDLPYGEMAGLLLQ